ncbi:MAG: PVC-type heme-binding CxxCH protein [Pirellulales bacterium]
MHHAGRAVPASSFCLFPSSFCLPLLVLLAIGGHAAAAKTDQQPAQPFDVPDGFEVSLYADDDLAHDIFSMTIDAQGRVVVAGRDYVKILHDADGDGRAERASLFSPTPKSGAHGMYFDGPDLICTGDDAVRRLSDRDGDGKADDEGEVWTRLRHPEHGANGIVRGPDGWYWLIAGNDAGISTEHAALAGSPVKTPRSGGVVRFSPDGKRSDVFAHGFRNPYDLDFNSSGHLFTVDSDGERDHHLPWYAPTRLFDIAQGMEHGWLLQGWQRSWNRPQSFFDNVPRLAELGRGSPTGLVVYRHRQFPERFRDGVFTCCWTFGRVYFVPLKPDKASLSVDPAAEVFLQTAGDHGFAPVDLAVGPEGDLFVAVGGRGTRGGVFRVRYQRADRRAAESADPLDRVLRADQPLASWSRARWVPLARQLGRDRFTAITADAAYPVDEQIRAVEVLVEQFGGLSPDDARRAVALNRPNLTARVAWALERHDPADEAQSILAELTYAEHPAVARAAWEALAALPELDFAQEGRRPNWLAASRDECRRVRAAMLTAARGPGHASFQHGLGQVAAGEPPRQRMARLWAVMPQADEPNAAGQDYFDSCLAAFDEAAAAEERLEAVRLVQIGLGDLRVQPGQPEVYSGYSGNATDEVATEIRQRLVEWLAPACPAADAELNRELARLLGMLSADDPGLPEAIVDRVSHASLPKDDIHYLIVLSRLPAARTAKVTQATAVALAGLHPKLAARGMYPDRNWPLRVAELFDELCRRDSHLAATLARHEAFGLPDHSLFAAGMSGPARQAAAGRLLALATESDDAPPWTSQLVTVLGSLPAERVLPHLREQWSDYGLRDAIALVLADHGQTADRERLVEALSSADGNVVRRAAEALAAFNSPQPAELATAVRTLREYCAAKEHSAVRQALAGLLRAWAGHEIAIDEQAAGDLSAAYQPWFDWFAAQHPDEAARLADFAGADAAAWRERLAAVDFSQGDVGRGKVLFEKRACHRCHVAAGRLGPDLRGAAARFSPQDLFAAIVEPSKEVSPLYQTTLVTTRGGQVYHGLLVYDSADGLLLQTSPDTTVRVTGDDIDQVLPSRQSLMPTGLLNDATDQDLADLYAYLKTIH